MFVSVFSDTCSRMKLVLATSVFLVLAVVSDARPGGGRSEKGRPGGGRPRPPPGGSTPAPTLVSYDGDCFVRVRDDADAGEIIVVLKFSQPVETLNVADFTVQDSKDNKKFVLVNSNAVTAGSLQVEYTAEYFQGRRPLRGFCKSKCNRPEPTPTEGPFPTESSTTPESDAPLPPSA